MITLSNLISQTWSLYNNNLKTYLKLSLFIFLITVPVGVVGLLLNTLKYAGIVSMAINIIVSFFVFLLTILITIVLVKAADKQISAQSAVLTRFAVRASALSIRNEFKAALGLWFAVLLLSIIVGFIQIAGFILLIIPGILFSVWFAFTIYYVILEKKGIKESLYASKSLSRGRFWGVLSRIFVPTILWSLFGWAVSEIFINLVEIIQRYFIAHADKFVSYSLEFLKLLGLTYINSLFVPLFIISMVILFRDLQANK